MVFDYLKIHRDISIRYGISRCRRNKKGTVILLGGRAEFMEKYAETVIMLNQRGFDVYSMEWRGQGLSTRLLSNPHKGYVIDYTDYIGDLKQFLHEIVMPEAAFPLILLAHSMGAHITLRFLREYSHDDIRKAVLTSPMIDIYTSPYPQSLARLITWIAMKTGLAHTYVPGAGDYEASQEKFKGNKLTSDPVRFLKPHKLIAENPALALGGVTYGWLDATFKSIDMLSANAYTTGIKASMLMVSAGADEIIPAIAQKKFCNSMKNCQFTVIPNARHEILNDTDAVQAAFWKVFDGFV